MRIGNFFLGPPLLNAADAAAEAEDELLLGCICAQAAVPSLLLTARGSCPLRAVR